MPFQNNWGGFWLSTILPILLIPSVSLAEHTIIYAEKVPSFSFEKDGELNVWTRSRTEFHVRSFSIKLAKDQYWQKHLLILEEYTAKTHIGIPMLKSKMKLTAWELTSTQRGEKLWEIEQEADAWEDKGSEIILVKYGCCDAPNIEYKYDTISGQLLKQ